MVKKIKNNIFTILSVMLAIVFGTFLRIYFLKGLEGDTGGDIYNFLESAKRMIDFQNPFLGRRLPFFSILLIPSILLDFDPIMWTRLINIVISVISGILVFKISLKLKMKPAFSLVASILTLSNAIFLTYSLRPLSHVFFAFLILLAIYLFIDNLKKNVYLISLVLGIMCLTRYEGFPISLFILGFIYYKYRFSVIKALSIFSIIIFPLVISNFIQYGNPFYSSYLSGEGLYIFKDLSDFIRNLRELTNSFIHIWGQTTVKFFANYYVNKIEIVPYLFTGFVLLGFIYMYRNRTPNNFVISIIILIQIVVSFVLQPSSRYLVHIVPIVSIVATYGIYYLYTNILKLNKYFAVVFTIALIIIYVVTQFLNSRRFFDSLKYDSWKYARLDDVSNKLLNLNSKFTIIGKDDDQGPFIYHFFNRNLITENESDANYLLITFPISSNLYSKYQVLNKYKLADQSLRFMPVSKSLKGDGLVIGELITQSNKLVKSENVIDKRKVKIIDKLPQEFVVNFDIHLESLSIDGGESGLIFCIDDSMSYCASLSKEDRDNTSGGERFSLKVIKNNSVFAESVIDNNKKLKDLKIWFLGDNVLASTIIDGKDHFWGSINFDTVSAKSMYFYTNSYANKPPVSASLESYKIYYPDVIPEFKEGYELYKISK